MAQKQPNPIELYQAAAQGFRRTLSGVKPNQMTNPTPCTLWNVQALINHNIKVAAFARQVFEGNITVDAMDVSGPLPPEGALEALDTGVASVVKVIKAPGALERDLNTPFGTWTGGNFILMPFMDLLVHTWDLAKGTSQNTKLDSGLVEFCHHNMLPAIDSGRNLAPGGQPLFQQAVSVSPSTRLQDKLIAWTGRKP